MVNKYKITILTDPLPIGMNFYFILLKKIFNLIKNLVSRQKRFKNFYYKKWSYGGHPAVTRSIITGFKKCKINFNYNPQEIGNLSDNVLVLAGIKTLKQAIYLKKKDI